MRHTLRINIPNLISFARLLSVPLVVWLILSDAYLWAFWVFLVACASDAVDGFIAKRFNSETVLGGFLDPVADKALLVSVFVALGHAGFLPTWLVILVVFRDGLILLGAFLYHVLYQRLTMEPLLISKLNTTVQFLLVLGVLGMAGYELEGRAAVELIVYVVAVTTFASGTAYVWVWGRRTSALEPGE